MVAIIPILVVAVVVTLRSHMSVGKVFSIPRVLFHI